MTERVAEATKSMATNSGPLVETQVEEWIRTLDNGRQWPGREQFGALNYITPALRARAAASVKAGRAVSCGWEIDPQNPGDYVFSPPVRHMVEMFESADAGAQAGCSVEYLGMVFHGRGITHLDVLCHTSWKGRVFAGVPASSVTVGNGATRFATSDLPDGISGRGVLLDIPRLRGLPYLPSGTGVMPEELEAAEAAQGVTVGEGDIVLLRTGWGAQVDESPELWKAPQPRRSGWDPTVLPWLHERRVAAIGHDTSAEVFPPLCPEVKSPVHVVGQVAIGLFLLDNCRLEELSRACAEEGRWDFLLVVGSLRLRGGTGSPINPVAFL